MTWQPPLPTLPLPWWDSHHCLVPDDGHSFLYAIGSFWDGCEVVFSNGFLCSAEGTVSTSRHLQITTEEGWNKPIVSRFAVTQQQRHKRYGFPLATGSPRLSLFSLSTLISTVPQPEDFHPTQPLGQLCHMGAKHLCHAVLPARARTAACTNEKSAAQLLGNTVVFVPGQKMSFYTRLHFWQFVRSA